MTPKRPYTLKIDKPLLAALKQIKERDGVGESEQIRRGIKLWLKSKGIDVEKTDRKRAATRKRS